MPDNQQNIPEVNEELHSEQVHEILSYVPHVLVRWGSTIIAATIVLMLVGSYFIRYPEIIPAKVVVQSTTPAAKIVAKSAGRIKIRVNNNVKVAKGQVLAVIENPAITEDILKARFIADSIRNTSVDSLRNPLLPQLLLGSAQSAYLRFAEDYREAVYKIRDKYTDRKVENIQAQLKSLRALNDKLNRQKRAIIKELNLAAQDFERNQKLFEQGVISQSEFENKSAVYLSKQRQVDDLDLTIINNQIQTEEYNKLLLDFEQNLSEQLLAIRSNLYQSLSYLEVAINEWFYQYALVAPNDGLLSYYRFFSDNDLVAAGEQVFAIISQNKNIQVWAEVPLVGAGKIKVGQKVNIKLQSYPYKEYGMLIGVVEQITALPNNNVYRLLIGLPEGLKTTYNVELAFRQEMLGSGEILTKELSLFDRIFNELRSVVKN